MIKKLVLTGFLFSFISFSYAAEQRYNVPIEGSPSCGAATAQLTVIEFLDYQ